VHSPVVGSKSHIFKDVAGLSAHTIVLMVKQDRAIAKLSIGLEG
jgi:hypothetical protein